MSEYCREVQERIEEKVEKPVEEWVEKRRKKCKKKKCKKWCLCCNKWFCWIETFLERVVTWVVVTVVKWVIRVVCEIVDGALSIVGVLIGLVFAIPIIGRLIRQIWDFLLEIFWRLVGILGTLADIIGWEWRKRLRICIVVLREEKGPVATQADLQPHIDSAKRIYDQAANVDLIVEGVHTIEGIAPDRALDVSCDVAAWGEDRWLVRTNGQRRVFRRDGSSAHRVGVTHNRIRGARSRRKTWLLTGTVLGLRHGGRPECRLHSSRNRSCVWAMAQQWARQPDERGLWRDESQ